MRTKGTVKSWNPDKGFGFVSTDKDGDIFVHINQLTPAARRIAISGKFVGTEVTIGQIVPQIGRRPEGREVGIETTLPLAGGRVVVLKNNGNFSVSLPDDAKAIIDGLKTTVSYGHGYWTDGKNTGNSAEEFRPANSFETWYFRSGSGKSASRSWVKRDSGVAGLLACAGDEKLFWSNIVAVEFASFDSDAVTVIVAPGTAASALKNVSFAERNLGISITVIEAEASFYSSRLVSNESKSVWSVQVAEFISWRNEPVQISRWTEGAAVEVDLPYEIVGDGSIPTYMGISVSLAERGKLPLFSNLRFAEIEGNVHDPNIVELIHEYVDRALVPAFQNGTELGAEFDRRLPALLESASRLV